METDPISYQIITGFSGILPYRFVRRGMPQLGVHTICVIVKGQIFSFAKGLP